MKPVLATTAVSPATNMPTRLDLTEIYTTIKRGLDEIGAPARTIVMSGARAVMTEAQLKVIETAVSGFEFEEQVYLRILNDHNRYFLGEDLVYVARALNEKLTTVSELENSLRTEGPRAVIEQLPGNPVISDYELLFDHLRYETPFYLRKLLSGSLNSRQYYMVGNNNIKQEVRDSLEAQASSWLLRGEAGKHDLIRILSLIDRDGRPANLRESPDREVRLISDIIAGMVNLADIRRSAEDPFNRFVHLLPSVLFQVLGTSDSAENPLSQKSEDRLNDLAEASKIFIRSLQDHAEKASSLRTYLHHGFPMFTELLRLSVVQNNLMSWNFESILHMLSYLIFDLTADRRNSRELLRFFGTSNILATYATQKGAYLKRESKAA